MNLQIKVYKPDYGVILKNYLDPKNWEEITIYQYRNYVSTIQLTNINVRAKMLDFTITTKNGYESSTQYVSYKLDHPEYTLKTFENAVKSALRTSLYNTVKYVNYKDTYESLYARFNREAAAIDSEIRETIRDIYHDLPSMVQSVIEFEDLLDRIVEDKQRYRRPTYLGIDRHYYEQEMNIFDGIQTIIEDRDYGVVDLSDSMKIIEALETGDYDELDEDELDELKEMIDVEDIDLEDYV